MTIEEFNALEECSKDYYLRWRKSTLEEWAKQKDVISLPFPENYIRFVYGENAVIKKPLDVELIRKILCEIDKKYSDAVMAIFADKMSLEEYSESVGLVPETVNSYIAREARRFRLPTTVHRLCENIELIRGADRLRANGEECESDSSGENVARNADDVGQVALDSQKEGDIAEEFLSIRAMLKRRCCRHERLGL